MGTKQWRKAPDLTPAQWSFLNDDPWPAGTTDVERFVLEHDSMGQRGIDVRALWRLHGPTVMERWIAERPGTRPRLWWRFDAPTWAGDPWPACYWSGTKPEPRLRVGGSGRPIFEVQNYVPYYWKGIPVRHVGVVAGDPPLYEAECEYLKRHGLLKDAELELYEAGELDTAPEPFIDNSDWVGGAA
jgi:hypothetical protein